MSFEKYFPKTLAILGAEGEALMESYRREMSLSEKMAWQDLRYFAGFLRQKVLLRGEACEVAQWEWIQCYLQNEDFLYELKADAGQVLLNPSYQSLSLQQYNSILQRDAGLYIFVFHRQKKLIVEKSLDLLEAHLVEALLEDRKYSQEQLLAAVSLELPGAASEEWQQRLQLLLSGDILSVSPPA